MQCRTTFLSGWPEHRKWIRSHLGKLAWTPAKALEVAASLTIWFGGEKLHELGRRAARSVPVNEPFRAEVYAAVWRKLILLFQEASALGAGVRVIEVGANG